MAPLSSLPPGKKLWSDHQKELCADLPFDTVKPTWQLLITQNHAQISSFSPVAVMQTVQNCCWCCSIPVQAGIQKFWDLGNNSDRVNLLSAFIRKAQTLAESKM
jgi:hypothetical protein